MNRPFYVLIFIFLLFLRYLELQRSTGSLSLTMIMFLFSPLLMITYGSGITRLVPVLVELCELLNSDVRIFFWGFFMVGGGGGSFFLVQLFLMVLLSFMILLLLHRLQFLIMNQIRWLGEVWTKLPLLRFAAYAFQ